MNRSTVLLRTACATLGFVSALCAAPAFAGGPDDAELRYAPIVAIQMRNDSRGQPLTIPMNSDFVEISSAEPVSNGISRRSACSVGLSGSAGYSRKLSAGRTFKLFEYDYYRSVYSDEKTRFWLECRVQDYNQAGIPVGPPISPTVATVRKTLDPYMILTLDPKLAQQPSEASIPSSVSTEAAVSSVAAKHQPIESGTLPESAPLTAPAL